MQPKMQYAPPNLEFIRFEQDEEIADVSVVATLPDDGSGDAVIIW